MVRQGVESVVVEEKDKEESVRGKGFEIMREEGIEVVKGIL